MQKQKEKYQARSTSYTGETIEYASIMSFDKNTRGLNKDFELEVNKVFGTLPDNYKLLENPDRLDPDFMYIFVDVTVLNKSNLDYRIPRFYLKDINGYKYETEVSKSFSPQFKLKELQSGDKNRGDLAFRIKKDFGNLKLYMEIDAEKYTYFIVDLGNDLNFSKKVDDNWNQPSRESVFDKGEINKIEPFEITVLEAQRITFPSSFDKAKNSTDDFGYDFNPKMDQSQSQIQKHKSTYFIF
jgi:hypothetical protein